MDANRGSRIKKFRNALNMTQSVFAAEIGKTLPSVQRYEANERQIDKTTVMLLALKLGLNPHWLDTGEGGMFLNEETGEGECRIPVYDVYASAGYGAWANGEAVTGYYKLPENLVRREWGASPKNTFMLYVKGDSMAPVLLNGDLVAIDKSRTEARKGLYVCRIENDLYIKNVTFQRDAVILTSENPMYDPIVTPYDAFELIGKVIWYGRAIR